MKMKKMKKMMAVLLGLSLVTAMSAGPAFAADKMPRSKTTSRWSNISGIKYSISTILLSSTS